jgi:hypothetical protein
MTQQEKITFKNQLKLAARSLIELRIAGTRAAIEEAQQTANGEEKSSAGDKYETSRAMGHLEKDLQSRQLAAHLKELASLHSIRTEIICQLPEAGAFIRCSSVSFFIACGLGRQAVNGEQVVFLSPHAPLALSLRVNKAGDKLVFGGVENVIEDVF